MISALFKREFAGYFRTPVAYVVLVAFLLATNALGFFAGRFFDGNVASLEPFFFFHPWLFLFLVPAVGMRLWAEERRSGSLELLFTLPITPIQAVVAKFLAGWLFLTLAILLTFPLALTVGFLGSPDWGVIAGSYLGSILMAGAYLAITGLMSSLTKSQVIAFVTSVFVCLGLVLIGYSLFSDLLSAIGLPVWLIDAIANFGFIPHFESVTRGLVDLRSLIYFASVMAFALFLTVVALERTSSQSGRKMLSVALLFAGLVLVNYVTSAFAGRLDLTAEGIFTLSPGTRSLLKKVEEPVNLQFYFSRSSRNLPVRFKNYATRVEELLRQYARAAGGKVKLTVIDPKPDSKEEEAATKSGVTGQPLGDGTSIYFGLVAQQADLEKAIAFFSPQRESFLEYDVSQLLYTVQQFNKPKLGLLTALPLRAPAFAMPGMPQQPGQVVAEEWARTYEIVEVQPTATELPAGLEALAVIQPQNLPEKLLFAIDQFVLAGKPVFVAVDPSSRASRNQSRQMSMMGQQPNVSSDLPRLLAAWGVTFNPQNVVGDLDLASTVQTQQGTSSFPTWLTLRRENLNRQFVPASDVKAMILADAGSFTVAKTEGIDATTVIETSTRSGDVNAFLLQFGEQADLSRQVKPDGKKKTLAVLLHGNFKTAFPGGAPKEPAKPKSDKSDPSENPKPETPNPKPESTALAVSAKPGTVFLIADTDWLFDDYSLDPRYRRAGILVPINDNLTFATNVLDYLGGSNDLISIRGKGTALRPFEVFRKMEVAAQAQYQERLETLETRLQDVQRRLSDLLKGQKDTAVLVATPQMQAEIDQFRAEEVKMRSERREIRHALREGIERLQNWLIVFNLLTVPACVIVDGVWFFSRRNRRRKTA